MGPSDAVNILILVLLLLLSAFFSSAETALTTVNKIRMRALAEEKNKAAKRVLKLIEDPTKMLSAVLICNNIVNLSASSLSTSYAFRICQRMGFSGSTSLGAGIATGILTILILIFGEITPKNLATRNAEKMSLVYSSTILFLTNLLTPVIFIVNKISHFFLWLLRVDTSKKVSSITEDELRTFVEVSHEEGVIESEERQMITNIVDFGDSLAKDVMIPRMDIAMVEANITYEDLLKEFTKNKYARLPVYEDTIDNIIGIINLKDFVFYTGDKETLDIRTLMREAHMTYEYKNVAELFMEMQKESIPLTIVLDEYGALAGLITIEDLIEEIVGELRDEYDDDEEDEIQKISDNEYIFLGSADLEDIDEILDLKLESDDYDSIAGHVINLLEHFPEVGETAEDDVATYTVLEVEGNRVDKIRMILKPRPENDEDEDEDL
ncbi:MAG: hemolysin family protein [Eubacterium sp.]|nr:hemolysin family protein [Eubacterium sp.]